MNQVIERRLREMGELLEDMTAEVEQWATTDKERHPAAVITLSSKHVLANQEVSCLPSLPVLCYPPPQDRQPHTLLSHTTAPCSITQMLGRVVSMAKAATNGKQPVTAVLDDSDIVVGGDVSGMTPMMVQMTRRCTRAPQGAHTISCACSCARLCCCLSRDLPLDRVLPPS